MAGSNAARSPAFQPVTPGPTRTTTPAGSCPNTIGYWHGVSPTPPSAYECTSEPQMPTASMRTCTSPGPGSASAASTNRNWRNPQSSATRAFMGRLRWADGAWSATRCGPAPRGNRPCRALFRACRRALPLARRAGTGRETAAPESRAGIPNPRPGGRSCRNSPGRPPGDPPWWGGAFVVLSQQGGAFGVLQFGHAAGFLARVAAIAVDQQHIHLTLQRLRIAHAAVARNADGQDVAGMPETLAHVVDQRNDVLRNVALEVPLRAGQVVLVGHVHDQVAEVVRDQPVGNVHGGVMYGFGGPELPGLAVVEIHQVDEHAALVGGAQQAFQPREPIRLERTIRPESAHIGPPAGAEAIGVLAIDAVDGLVVSGLRALQADVDHEHAVTLVEIQRLDYGIRVEFGIEGPLVHPLVEKQSVGQADVHE